MHTDMEMWRNIGRRFLVEGEAKRQICREYGIHFMMLQKILEHVKPLGPVVLGSPVRPGRS